MFRTTSTEHRDQLPALVSWLEFGWCRAARQKMPFLFTGHGSDQAGDPRSAQVIRLTIPTWNLSLLTAAAGLGLERSLRPFSHRLRLVPKHLCFDSGDKVLADFDVQAFHRLDNLPRRGVHP